MSKQRGQLFLFACIVTVLGSALGFLWCLNGCYLVGFAAYHGIPEADRQLTLFRFGLMLFGLLFISSLIGTLKELVDKRRKRGE